MTEPAPDMRFRPHRGGFQEALRDMVEIPATAAALRAHLIETYILQENFQCADQVAVGEMFLKDQGHDLREGWSAPSYLVVVDGYGPCGHVDALPDGCRIFSDG